MIATEPGLAPGYFGKLPSRGDFVRSPGSDQLLLLLDRWAGQGLELLAADPGWKQAYDHAPPLQFAFLGSRSRLAIGGHFAPSRDASQRRFPFLCAARFEVAQPLPFIARSPLALSRLWSNLSRHARQAVAAEEAGAVLRELTEARVPVSTGPGDYDAPFGDFLDMQDLAALQSLLRGSGHAHLRLRWLLPALGLLLQPVLTGGPAQIDKALALPLPLDPLYRPLVASLWLDLLSGFLARADFELTVLLTDPAAPATAPELVVGFNGADARTLHAALDPHAAAGQLIRVDDAEWVEAHLDDYALNKLASYLERDALPLRLARTAFRETFLGL